MVSQPLTNGPKKKPLTACLFYYGCLSGDAHLQRRGGRAVVRPYRCSHLAVTQAQVRYLRREEEGGIKGASERLVGWCVPQTEAR